MFKQIEQKRKKRAINDVGRVVGRVFAFQGNEWRFKIRFLKPKPKVTPILLEWG